MAVATRDQIDHALDVAARVRPEARLVALLHDSTEDDLDDFQLLADQCDPTERAAILLLTHLPHVSYPDYIDSIAYRSQVSDRCRALAIEVKLADLQANLDRMDEAHEHNREKYLLAQGALRAARVSEDNNQ